MAVEPLLPAVRRRQGDRLTEQLFKSQGKQRSSREQVYFLMNSADENNGCLEVIPGSHKYGVLEQREIVEVVSNVAALSCIVEPGDAVIMRPHVVHRSRKSRRPGHRRVVHLEFSDFELPTGRTWA